MGNNLILLLYSISGDACENKCVTLFSGSCQERIKFLLLANECTVLPKACISAFMKESRVSAYLFVRVYCKLELLLAPHRTSYFSPFSTGKITFMSVFSHTNKCYKVCWKWNSISLDFYECFPTFYIITANWESSSMLQEQGSSAAEGGYNLL